jgi:hypothetical protein
MTTTFFTAMWNQPGCLPDSSTPPPVFKDYGEAAEYLADELETLANGYDETEKDGDCFEGMAEACRTSTDVDRFAMDGPDGYRYAVEETEARGRWTAGEEQPSQHGASYVVLTYTESATGLGTTAKEAAADVSSVCGCIVEHRGGDTFAYVIVDSDCLPEAAEELRESGFELEDSDGELVA